MCSNIVKIRRTGQRLRAPVRQLHRLDFSGISWKRFALSCFGTSSSCISYQKSPHRPGSSHSWNSLWGLMISQSKIKVCGGSSCWPYRCVESVELFWPHPSHNFTPSSSSCFREEKWCQAWNQNYEIKVQNPNFVLEVEVRSNLEGGQLNVPLVINHE